MKDKIHLLRNYDNITKSDQEWIEEFYRFLQGDIPESIALGRGSKIKLTEKKAFSIIWYLQEHLPVFPDNIERCSFCGDLYNAHATGYYSDKKSKHYCGSCDTYLDDGHQDEE